MNIGSLRDLIKTIHEVYPQNPYLDEPILAAITAQVIYIIYTIDTSRGRIPPRKKTLSS